MPTGSTPGDVAAPDALATTSDRQSKRPTKKRALTPVSEQAANVDALFAKPDQDIRIPTGGPTKPRLAPPPEIVTNVQGSSAGAGSGEFHVYKASRRREYERLRRMDEELQHEKDSSEFEKAKRERESRDEEKTRKNREKREKMKARKAKKASATPGTKAPAADGAQDDMDGGAAPTTPSIRVDAPHPATSHAGPAQPAGIMIHDED